MKSVRIKGSGLLWCIMVMSVIAILVLTSLWLAASYASSSGNYSSELQTEISAKNAAALIRAAYCGEDHDEALVEKLSSDIDAWFLSGSPAPIPINIDMAFPGELSGKAYEPDIECSVTPRKTEAGDIIADFNVHAFIEGLGNENVLASMKLDRSPKPLVSTEKIAVLCNELHLPDSDDTLYMPDSGLLIYGEYGLADGSGTINVGTMWVSNDNKMIEGFEKLPHYEGIVDFFYADDMPLERTRKPLSDYNKFDNSDSFIYDLSNGGTYRISPDSGSVCIDASELMSTAELRINTPNSSSEPPAVYICGGRDANLKISFTGCGSLYIYPSNPDEEMEPKSISVELFDTDSIKGTIVAADVTISCDLTMSYEPSEKYLYYTDGTKKTTMEFLGYSRANGGA